MKQLDKYEVTTGEVRESMMQLAIANGDSEYAVLISALTNYGVNALCRDMIYYMNMRMIEEMKQKKEFDNKIDYNGFVSLLKED